MSIPPHPSDRNETIPRATSGRNRILIVLVAVAVVVAVALHLTGVVGPG